LATLQNTTIPNGGTLGSVSDPDAISISSGGKVTFSQIFIQDIGNHSKIRQFYYAAGLAHGNSVDLFRNSNAYDDISGLMWLEATHSGRTYRTYIFTIGGYGFNATSGGSGSLTVTNGGGYPGGTTALRITNSTGYSAGISLAGFILGDNAVTNINATIYD